MASFYDTTVGQQIEFQRVLASAGFTDSDIARIIKEPSLASTMFASIRPKRPTFGRVFDNQPSWWRTPEQQLERARQLWPRLVLPEWPGNFSVATATEVPLLHVPPPHLC